MTTLYHWIRQAQAIRVAVGLPCRPSHVPLFPPRETLMEQIQPLLRGFIRDELEARGYRPILLTGGLGANATQSERFVPHKPPD